MTRDYDKRPYTPEEERVSAYLQELFKGQVGSGEDPVGFLLASHAELGSRLRAGPVPGLFEKPVTPERVRELCDRIWQTTKKEVPAEEMLRDLALLCGVAVVHLMEYARTLEDPKP